MSTLKSHACRGQILPLVLIINTMITMGMMFFVRLAAGTIESMKMQNMTDRLLLQSGSEYCYGKHHFFDARQLEQTCYRKGLKNCKVTLQYKNKDVNVMLKAASGKNHRRLVSRELYRLVLLIEQREYTSGGRQRVYHSKMRIRKSGGMCRIRIVR